MQISCLESISVRKRRGTKGSELCTDLKQIVIPKWAKFPHCLHHTVLLYLVATYKGHFLGKLLSLDTRVGLIDHKPPNAFHKADFLDVLVCTKSSQKTLLTDNGDMCSTVLWCDLTTAECCHSFVKFRAWAVLQRIMAKHCTFLIYKFNWDYSRRPELVLVEEVLT